MGPAVVVVAQMIRVSKETKGEPDSGAEHKLCSSSVEEEHICV